jgi:hypothetical protein
LEVPQVGEEVLLLDPSIFGASWLLIEYLIMAIFECLTAGGSKAFCRLIYCILPFPPLISNCSLPRWDLTLEATFMSIATLNLRK